MGNGSGGGPSSSRPQPPQFHNSAHTSLHSHVTGRGGGGGDNDDDQTVGTLQTLRTTRTARTARTTATKRAEIDALFDDLLGDRDEDKGDGEAGGWQAEEENGGGNRGRRRRTGNDGDDFARQMHGNAGESIVSAASGLPSVSVPVGNGHRARRSQQMDDDELLFGDNGTGGHGDAHSHSKYAKMASAAAATGGLISTGLSAIGQFGSSSGYARAKKNDDASRGGSSGGEGGARRYNASSAANGYKSSYASTLKGSGGGASRRSGGSGASVGTHRTADSSVVTHGVSSILESMGLGGDEGATSRRRSRPGELDGFLANQGEVARGNAVDINGAYAPSSFPFSRHNSRSKPGTMVHLRAGMIMLSLIGLVYSAVQLSVVVKHERGARGGRFSRLPGGKVRPLPPGAQSDFDEGMDRPLSEKALKSLRGKASSAGDMMGMAAAPATGGNAAGLPKPVGASQGDMGPLDALPGLGGGGGGAGFADAVDPGVKALVTEYMPFQYDYVADLSSRYTKAGVEAFMKETPIFWHIPRSGGRMIIDLMSRCYSIKYSVVVGDNLDDARTTLQDPNHEGVLVSSFVHETMYLLDSDHYARMFTFLRHPIERAASVYENHHKSHDQISKMSFEEYAKSKYAENNWMVRYLSGKTSGEVTNDHLSVAKEVLRRKFVIGLLDKKEESAKRIGQFFAPKWDPNGEGMGEGCLSMVVNDAEPKSTIKEGNQAWNLLVWQNKLDMKLYEYAQQLFAQQGEDLFVKKA